MTSPAGTTPSSSTTDPSIVADAPGLGSTDPAVKGSGIRTADVLKVLFIIALFGLGCLLLVVLAPLLLQPAVLGKVVSLSPVVVFIAILAGSQLLGITGALLAIPVAGVAQIFLREGLAHRGGEDLEVPPIAPDDVPDRPKVEAST